MQFKVLEGKPPPKQTRKKRSRRDSIDWRLDEIPVGACIEVPPEDALRARAAVAYWSREHSMAFTTKLDRASNMVRVWRLS